MTYWPQNVFLSSRRLSARVFIHINDLDDARLVPFRSMRIQNWTSGSGWFIAEGPKLVERLMRSSFGIHSLLISDKYLSDWLDRKPENVPAYVVPEERIAQLLGFNFHRGIIACGLRKPPIPLKDLSGPVSADTTFVALHGVQDPENMGGILRSCAALGIENILVGPKCADPLSRRVLRVSMGTVLSLKLFDSRRFADDLIWLRETHGAETIATTLSPDSEPLETARRNGPIVILMGNEAHGLPDAVQQLASRRIKIDMRLGTDSLNVSVAAGIVMHYFCRVCK